MEKEPWFYGPGKPWVARKGIDQVDQEMLGTMNVFQLLQKCLLQLDIDRYQAFWEQIPRRYCPKSFARIHRKIGHCRSRRPASQNTSIRERLRQSLRKFFDELAVRLIADITSSHATSMRGEMRPATCSRYSTTWNNSISMSLYCGN